MKKLHYALLIAGMALFSACDNSESNKEELYKQLHSCLVDAELVVGMESQIADYADTRILFSQTKGEEMEWEDKHEPLSYENSYIHVRVQPRSVRGDMTDPYTRKEVENSKAYSKFYKLTEGWSKETRLAINDYYHAVPGRIENKHLYGGLYNFIFYTAKIASPVTITCDKQLFGQKPGTDISSHFCVSSLSGCIPMSDMYENKLLFLGDKLPKSVEEHFVQDSWLANEYMFYLSDIPEEKYDAVSFTVSIPVTCENWLDYLIEKENSEEAQMTAVKKVLSASCTLYLGQQSTFRHDAYIDL